MKEKKLESFRYHFLRHARTLQVGVDERGWWQELLQNTTFTADDENFTVSWADDASLHFAKSNFPFYKVDNESGEKEIAAQIEASVLSLASKAGVPVHESSDERRFEIEQNFHDMWAEQESVDKLDVVAFNQMCTSPEMRYITEKLGDLKGKKLLDVGCGLGEASVYFALLGADVTSSDISPGMLKKTEELARCNNISVTLHLTTAENMRFQDGTQFDVIYAGNLLHHVDIDKTLERLEKYLSKDGIFVSWDPVYYNPVINIYRKIATEVRTDDEHPLRWRDLKLFEKHFPIVERKYFWFFTLIIFILMALQRRHPNNERYWKTVVKEGRRWEWLYNPLEKLDKIVLKYIPPLRLLCWNAVVIAGKKPLLRAGMRKG